MITLQPYQYVWFNEVARFFANEKNYEIDFWGYSMREAAMHAKERQGPADWVISPDGFNPSHLARIFLTERFSTDAAPVAPGTTYLLVSSTRTNTQPPKECDSVTTLRDGNCWPRALCIWHSSRDAANNQ